MILVTKFNKQLIKSKIYLKTINKIQQKNSLYCDYCVNLTIQIILLKF